ncbi:hypothetical protein HN873_043898 [Arachis hypogaea]
MLESIATAVVTSSAAFLTVDTYVKSEMVVGLGFGHASCMAIQHLGRQLRTGNLKNIVGIPIASEAAKSGIPLDTYQDSTQIDFAFDDADAIKEGTLVAIIGRRRHKQHRLSHGLGSCPPASTRFWIWRFIANKSLSIAASTQEITLSTCIVAHNNALFALLVSNNFAQIKSNVFKRYSRDNVYSLVYFEKCQNQAPSVSLETSIESTLEESDMEKRENGELLEMKVAMKLGRSISQLRELASKSASYRMEGITVNEFAASYERLTSLIHSSSSLTFLKVMYMQVMSYV